MYDTYNAEVIEYFKNREEQFLILDICNGEGWTSLHPFWAPLFQIYLFLTSRDPALKDLL